MSRGPSRRGSFLARVVGSALTGGGALVLVGALSAQPPPEPQARQEPAPTVSPPAEARCPPTAGEAAAAESEADRLVREQFESSGTCPPPQRRPSRTRGFSLSREIAPAAAAPSPAARPESGRFRPCRGDSDAGQVQDPRCKQ